MSFKFFKAKHYVAAGIVIGGNIVGGIVSAGMGRYKRDNFLATNAACAPICDSGSNIPPPFPFAAGPNPVDCSSFCNEADDLGSTTFFYGMFGSIAVSAGITAVYLLGNWGYQKYFGNQFEAESQALNDTTQITNYEGTVVAEKNLDINNEPTKNANEEHYLALGL